MSSASSLAHAIAVTPQERLSEIHGVQAKAALHPKEPETPLRELAKDAIQAIGKQESAATDAGLSGGRFSAKLADGSLRLFELERLGVSFAVKWAEHILEQYGTAMTPQQFIRLQVRLIRKACDEIESGTEATE